MTNLNADIELKSFVNSVEIILAQKGMTKTDLAEKMEISRQALSESLSGKHSPSFSRLNAIAKGLGVPLFVLLMTQEERGKWEIIENMTKPFHARKKK